MQFDKSDIDPRELISWFPDIAPLKSTYTPAKSLNVEQLGAEISLSSLLQALSHELLPPVQSKLVGDSNETARFFVLREAHESLLRYHESLGQNLL